VRPRRFLPVSSKLTVPFPPRRTILGGWRTPSGLGSLATGSQPSSLATLSQILLGIPEKRKVFISYHHHGDQAYKDALVAQYCDSYELLEDNSLGRMIDTDNLEYVEREIREDYIKGSSVTVLLCGAWTWERKFVDWEIYATLLKKAGIVGLQLPTLAPNRITNRVALPPRFYDNLVTGYAVWKTWSYMVANPGVLRLWIEESVSRSSSLIDNARPKMRRNGEMREHP
jgi:hypothetical protein